MKERQKIILIISAGHSGSTLLDLLMGTLPGVLSTGELKWLPWQTWRDGKLCKVIPKQDICTCLKTFKDCPLWSKVLENISKKIGNDILKDPLSYNMSFLSNKKYMVRNSYKSLYHRLLRKVMTFSIIYGQHFVVETILKSNKEPIYNTLLLYDAINETLYTKAVVDSSKGVLRAYAIWKSNPENTKIILLYKDAKSLAASRKHWNQDIHIKKALKNWFNYYKHIYIPILQKMIPCEILTIMYDEIAQEPDTVRIKLASFIGLDYMDGDWQINTKEMHIVAGNPMRFKGNIDIKYDDRWRWELNSEELELAEYYDQQMQNLISNLPKQWGHSTKNSLS